MVTTLKEVLIGKLTRVAKFIIYCKRREFVFTALHFNPYQPFSCLSLTDLTAWNLWGHRYLQTLVSEDVFWQEVRGVHVPQLNNLRREHWWSTVKNSGVSSAYWKTVSIRNTKDKHQQETTRRGRVHGMKSEDSMTHLADMLTERWVGDHLTQEVEVCRHQRHDSTADEHGHIIIVSQSHVLHTPDHINGRRTVRTKGNSAAIDSSASKYHKLNIQTFKKLDSLNLESLFAD